MTKAQSDHVAFSAVIASIAERNNGDTTKAGKALRSRLRAMDDEKLCEAWPEYAASGKTRADGNRFPTSMPRTLADTLIASRVIATAVSD